MVEVCWGTRRLLSFATRKTKKTTADPPLRFGRSGGQDAGDAMFQGRINQPSRAYFFEGVGYLWLAAKW